MQEPKPVSVRMFGRLHTLRKERGLQPSLEITLTATGRKASDIAMDLNLPLDVIGCIYCNHIPADLYHMVQPGDRIAFVPKSVPGPHQRYQSFPWLKATGLSTVTEEAKETQLLPATNACLA